MRAVIQRSGPASVVVENKVVGSIDSGLVVLLGIGPNDTGQTVQWMAEKVAHLRIFPDDANRMNRSLLDVGGGALVISQFTLYGDCRKGRRPNFMGAAPPEMAAPLVEEFCLALQNLGVPDVEIGVFGAHMNVSLINDGPVTIVIDSKDKRF